MIIVLSPAKSLDYDTPPRTKTHTLPDFIARSAELIEVLRKLSPAQIGTLMHISDPLAALNATRYADWSPEFTAENSKQAALAFDGDVYGGLDANSLAVDDLQFAQKHLRILSGLYGVLRPLDWMQPYRLEMGTRLANPRGKDLYAFWGDEVTLALNKLFKHTPLQGTVSVNLTCLVPGTDEHGNALPELPPAPARLGLGAMIRHFLVFRMETVVKRLEFDLGEINARIHILEGYETIFDALDETIRIIRKSQNKRDAAEKLMARFALSAQCSRRFATLGTLIGMRTVITIHLEPER